MGVQGADNPKPLDLTPDDAVYADSDYKDLYSYGPVDYKSASKLAAERKKAAKAKQFFPPPPPPAAAGSA